MFPRLDYLEWIAGRREVALYDLATSDLRGARDHEPAVVPGPLRDLDDPPIGATVELQLAQQYGVEPEQILVTPGATAANLIAAAATVRLARLNTDAEAAEGTAEISPRVLVEKPGYEPLVESPRGVNATVDRFLRADDFSIDPERVTAAMTPDTKLVTITNRHNPSGHLTDRETLEALASDVREGDARLLVDEVYAPYVTSDDTTDGDTPGGGAFGGPTAAGIDGTVVTGSLTKFYGLGDLRIGWLVADEPFVDAARSIEYHIGGVAGPSRALARRALHNVEHLGAEARALLAKNTRILTEFVTQRDDVDGTVEPGSTFAFLDVVGVDGDTISRAALDAGILVVPGRFFEDPERIRVSLGRNPETVQAGLDALAEVLDTLDGGDARQTEA